VLVTVKADIVTPINPVKAQAKGHVIPFRLDSV
jgi:hypothetical protein